MVTNGSLRGSLISGHCFILIDTRVEQKSGSSARKSITSQKFDRYTFVMVGDSPLARAVGVGSRFVAGFLRVPVRLAEVVGHGFGHG